MDLLQSCVAACTLTKDCITGLVLAPLEDKALYTDVKPTLRLQSYLHRTRSLVDVLQNLIDCIAYLHGWFKGHPENTHSTFHNTVKGMEKALEAEVFVLYKFWSSQHLHIDVHQEAELGDHLSTLQTHLQTIVTVLQTTVSGLTDQGIIQGKANNDINQTPDNYGVLHGYNLHFSSSGIAKIKQVHTLRDLETLGPDYLGYILDVFMKQLT